MPKYLGKYSIPEIDMKIREGTVYTENFLMNFSPMIFFAFCGFLAESSGLKIDKLQKNIFLSNENNSLLRNACHCIQNNSCAFSILVGMMIGSSEICFSFK